MSTKFALAVFVLLISANLAFAGGKLAHVGKLIQSSTLVQKVGALGLAAVVTCTSLGCETTDRATIDREPEIIYIYEQQPGVVYHDGRVTQHWERQPDHDAYGQQTTGHPVATPAQHWETQPHNPHRDTNQHEWVDAHHGWDDGNLGREHELARNPNPVHDNQILGGVVEQQHFTSYVHVDGGYRSTKRRIVYPGDDVYVVQADGGVYMGYVEREMPPNRVLVRDIYGTGVYGDAGQRKKIVHRDEIRGVALHYHQDVGMTIPLENDHRIFRRDDDDYMDVFYGVVADVYDDGYYRLDVYYGTAAGGIQVNLRDPYVIFMHKNIWPFEGIPLANHPDIGASVFVLGEEGSRIEFLLGEVLSVFHDGFYEVEIDTEIDIDDNYIELARPYRVFVHEDTPTRQGGIIFQNRRRD